MPNFACCVICLLTFTLETFAQQNEFSSLSSGTRKDNSSATEEWTGSLSVLQNFKQYGQLRRAPYTHLVIPDALPAELYRQLEAGYLSDANLQLATGRKEIPQNYRLDLHGSVALQSDLVPALWKRFIEYHTSRAFFDEVHSIVGPAILQAHPQLKKTPAVTGLRYQSSTEGTNVVMDTLMAFNSPVTRYSTVRGPHVDGADEIYAGLLYFRHREDNITVGGDLDVCKCRQRKCQRIPRSQRSRYGVGDTQYKPRDMKLMGRVPYKANQFVMFVNSATAIHSVTPRSISPYSRRLVNIVALKSGKLKYG